MSDHVKGRISKITEPNKGGYCAIVIDGNFYGSTKKGPPPGVSTGDVVEFDFYLKDGKYKTIQGGVTKFEGSVPAPTASSGGHAVSTKASSSGSYTSARDKYWEDKETYDRTVVQPRITFLAAYERALHFTDIVLREKAIPGLDKAKPEARLEIIQNFVQEIAEGIVVRSNAGLGAKPETLNKALDELEEKGWE